MPTVLIVDDNPLDRRLTGGLVNEANFMARFAKDGREALAEIERLRPDIVLTDLDMPEMDGLELVHAIRRHHATIPVILMTSHGSEEIAVAALEAGACAYVPKRSLAAELSQTLEPTLSLARSLQARAEAFQFLTQVQSRFVLTAPYQGVTALVSYCQDAMNQFDFATDSDLLRVGTALREALINAIDHGNLELASTLKEDNDGREYDVQRRERLQQPPYCERLIHVTMQLNHMEAAFIIRDEGPGFDTRNLPDPTDPENITRPYGRGLTMIQLFADQVTFNAQGNEITLVFQNRCLQDEASVINEAAT